MAKNSHTKQVEKAIKDDDSKDVDLLLEIADDADRYSALKSVLNSEGGELLIKALVDDMMMCVDRLTADYGTMPHNEMVGLCARLASNRNIVKSLHNAVENLAGAEEALAEALR